MAKHEADPKKWTPNPLNTPNYVPKHGAAGSDLPPRDAGVKSAIIKLIPRKKDGK